MGIGTVVRGRICAQRGFGIGEGPEFDAADYIGVNVRHELGVLHSFSFLGLMDLPQDAAVGLSTNYLQIRIFGEV